MILYEYPFNERVRTYLRLEHLFVRLSKLVARDDALDHHFALATIFEIMDVGARADLKSEVLKDLDRQKHQLDTFRGNPAIAVQVLDQVLNKLDSCFQNLSGQPGKPGQALTENDWLMSIRSRIGIPGGTCEFDLPSYYAWQNNSGAQRQADLQRWCASLRALADAVELLLQLLRDAGTPHKVLASAGQYQQNLPQGRSYQLMRLALDPALQRVPEISGNRLMVSIRLLRPVGDGHWQADPTDTELQLALCA